MLATLKKLLILKLQLFGLVCACGAMALVTLWACYGVLQFINFVVLPAVAEWM